MIDFGTNIEFAWPLVFCLILSGLAAFLYFRKVRSFYFLRIIAFTLVVVSFFLLLFPPDVLRDEVSTTILLNTENVSSDSLELWKLKYPNHKVLEFPEFSLLVDSLKETEIPTDESVFGGVVLLGDGIEEAEWSYLQHFPLQVSSNTPPSTWDLPLTPLNAVEGDEICADWRWGGLPFDSLQVFRLGKRILPRDYAWDSVKMQLQIPLETGRSGKYLYEIKSFIDSNEIIHSFGFEVFARQKQEILLLSGEADYEMNFVLKLLEEEKHDVKARFRIANDLYHYKNANVGTPFADLLPTGNGLLVINASALLSLSKLETEQLAKRMNKGNLNTILLQTSPNIIDRLPSPLKEVLLTTSTSNSQINKHFIGSSEREDKIAVESLPFYFKKRQGKPVLTSEAGRVLSVLKRSKYGKVLWTSIVNTHLASLEKGDAKMAVLWEKQFAAVKHELANDFHLMLPKFPVISAGEINKIQLLQREAPRNWKLSNGSKNQKLAFKNSYWMNSYWESNFISDSSGWHQLENESTKFNIYLSAQNTWDNYRRRVFILLNKRQFENLKTKEVWKDNYKKREPLSMIYAFLLFLFSMSLLWVIDKWKK